MKIKKVGLNEGVWSIEVKPENAEGATLKTKRMPDEFHKIWYSLVGFIGELIGESNGVNRLNSFNLSNKKEGIFCGLWFQKSLNGLPVFVKLDNMPLKKREEYELDELLKEIDSIEDAESKEAEKRRYWRYSAMNKMYDAFLQMEAFLNNNWDNLVGEDDGQIEMDFDGLESAKANVKDRVEAMSLNTERDGEVEEK